MNNTEQPSPEKQSSPETPAVPRPQLTRMPSWGEAYERMEKAGMLVASNDPGQLISHEWFETALGLNRNHRDYGLELSEMNQFLEAAHGLRLTSRGTHEKGYWLAPVNRFNQHVSTLRRKMVRLARRTVLYPSAVLRQHGKLLTDTEKRIAEKNIELDSAELLALSNRHALAKILENTPQKKLERMRARADAQLEKLRPADNEDEPDKI